VAIALSDSANNEVTQNTLQHNEYAIQIVESNPTVIFGNNMIKQNTITDNTYAIWIQRTASNTITENIIQNNINAIDGKTGAMSNYNTVHHNAFINNTANIANPQLKIQWDDGKEGNYWSDYNGTDTTGDGVGETPYTIYIVMQDTHPLVNMIPEFPTTTTLPLFALATVLAAAFYRKIKTN
jgi:parallel beta-helix repeat protein